MFVPWEIIVGFMAMVAVQWIITYFRRADCEEEKRAFGNQAVSWYRDLHNRAWQDSKEDFQQHQKDRNESS